MIASHNLRITDMQNKRTRQFNDWNLTLISKVSSISCTLQLIPSKHYYNMKTTTTTQSYDQCVSVSNLGCKCRLAAKGKASEKGL